MRSNLFLSHYGIKVPETSNVSLEGMDDVFRNTLAETDMDRQEAIRRRLGLSFVHHGLEMDGNDHEAGRGASHNAR